MKKILFLIFTGLLALNGVGAGFRAGVAVRVVTPDPLLPVSGGVGPSNPVTRKEGELTVRALVLEQGDTRVAIVGADFLGFPSALGNRVRAQVRGVAGTNILIGATHTHSAPDCYAFPDGKGGTGADLKYLDSVCARMAEAINEAVANLKPARLKIATGEAKGKIAYNYYADALYDPRCHVIQAVGTDGHALVTLVNYAVHPEVIGSERGILSADLVGPLYDRIRAQGGGTAVFMNSAQGGMVTADNRKPDGQEARDWPECVRIGQLLADEALRIVREAPLQENPALFCAARPLSFPVDSPLMRQIMKASPLMADLKDDARVTTQLNVVNVGNAQIVTVPGEALPNIGFYLKRKMRGEHNLLFGLTNDAFGYMLTRVDWGSFRRYDYVSRTSLGENTGEILIEEVLRFVAACPRPEPFVP
ncbi:MAG: hypothetical protein HY043_24485 [Verrucomicrobia bacterium]|nr:hypothetical protein [Verrucomicrobiota bacterium]